MSLGAIEALKRANRLSEVVVGGSDGNADALELIMAGELKFTTFQNGEAIGKGAIETALEVLSGKNSADARIRRALGEIDTKEVKY